MPPQVDLVFAAVAGVLTAFSPCGVPFLPTLWTEHARRATAGSRASVLSGFLTGTLAFILPFGTAGALAAVAVRELAPWLVLVSGFAVLGLAAYAWRRGAPPLPLGPLRRLGGRGRPIALGFSYGMAAIGCTSPIFFAVLLVAVSSGQPSLLLAFGVSFIAPLAVLAVFARELETTFRDAVRRRVSAPERVAQYFLIVLGVYLIVFFFVAPLLGIPL